MGIHYIDSGAIFINFTSLNKIKLKIKNFFVKFGRKSPANIAIKNKKAIAYISGTENFKLCKFVVLIISVLLFFIENLLKFLNKLSKRIRLNKWTFNLFSMTFLSQRRIKPSLFSGDAKWRA